MFALNRFKTFFRHASIRPKPTWAMGSRAILALIIVASALSFLEHIKQKQQTEKDLSSLASIVAWNSKAALAFKDPDMAQEPLQTLKNQSGIISARLYDSEGRPVAVYKAKTAYKENGQATAGQIVSLVKNGSSVTPTGPSSKATFGSLILKLKKTFSRSSKRTVEMGYSEVINYDQHGHLSLFRPIFIGNELIGILHLVDDLSRLNAHLSSLYLIIGTLVFFASLAVLYVSMRLQRMFSDSMLNLMQAMRSVTQEKKFTTRVAKTNNDEFGQLIDVYNEMLDEIHSRDELLEWRRGMLATQVNDRTAELSKKNVELQRVVAEALAAKEEAEAANLAKSQFLANISHEIRTPMNAVLGMADFIWHSNLTDEQRRSVEVMKQSSKLLLSVINDTLDFSKIESGKLSLSLQQFNCRDLIQSSFELLHHEAKAKDLRYNLRVNTELPNFLLGDSARLSQVLVSLLSNALKFTAQGEVTLGVSSQVLPGQKVRLSCVVTDTGIGIAPNQLDLIFEAFSQVDSTMTRIYRGTGLGLAIAKQLVHLMQGQIGVNSQPGIGSTFWFWVDLEQSKTPPKPRKSKANYRFKAKLLVAEDYPANQLVVQRFLEDLGCQVHLVNNGFEAVKALKNQHFDLVFMDCQMPFMDGYQATEEIRLNELACDSGNHIPIIALTAHALVEDETKCKEAGMDEWVTKPFTRQDLSKTLQKWLPKELIIADQPALKTDIDTLTNAINAVEDSTAINMEFFTRQFKMDNNEDLAFITSLTAAFQHNAAQTLSSLQMGIENEDAGQVRKMAHGLKSLCTNVGSGKLTEMCIKMEQAGTNNELGIAQNLLESMKQEYLRVLTELNVLSSKA
jgi:two-component system, sensor histidine kinase